MLAGSIGLTLLIGIRHFLPGEAASGGSFDAFCPFGAIESLWLYVTTGKTLLTTNLLNYTILGGVLAVSLLAGRAFCGWMCPVGALQEFMARLSRRLSSGETGRRGRRAVTRLPVSLSGSPDRILRLAKYMLLIAILAASATALYPPLHPFCPARAVFGLQLSTGLLWSVLVAFVVTSFLVERSWCKYLCPLGALLTLFNKIAPLRVVVDHSRCNCYGRCDLECPMDIRDIPARERDAECIQCLECLETCARDGSLTLELGGKVFVNKQ
jgi:polyferredoxin